MNPRSIGVRAAVAVLMLTAAHAALGDAAGTEPTSTLATKDGGEIYRQICAGCHMPDARGAVGAGYYPALAADRALAPKEYAARVVVFGRKNMPAFGAKRAVGFFYPPVVLSPEQIASVVNYVRSHFGNGYKDGVTAADVARLDTP